MKANKLMRTLAASAMSVALLAGVTALPAMAATPDKGVATGTTFETTSILQVPEKIATPNAILKFAVTKGTVAEGDKHDGMLVYEGVDGGLTVTESVTYTAAEPGTDLKGDEGAKYYEVSQKVTLTAVAEKFTHAGIYEYTVTVTNEPTVTGLTVDTAKTVYVYVQDNDGTPAVQAITMTNAQGGKVNNFVSTYLFDGNTPDPSTHTANIIVSKTVAGTFGDKTQAFNFPVTVPANLYYEITGGTGSKGMTDVSGTTTFKLTHGQTLTIYGVVENTSYTISESDYSSENYVTTVQNTNGTVTEDTTNVTGTIVAEQNVRADYTNTRDAGSITPTGIIMNVAPYALMVIVALAGVVVFMRKRVED